MARIPAREDPADRSAMSPCRTRHQPAGWAAVGIGIDIDARAHPATTNGTVAAMPQRHPMNSVAQPPHNGPTTFASTCAKPIRPKAWPRARSPSSSPTTANAAGTSNPDPTPCTSRKTNSVPMLWERHTPTVARPNTPIPARYIGRAPTRSVTTPAHGRTSVEASR